MNTLEARRRLLGRNVYKRTTEGNPAIAQGSLARRYPGITMQGWTEQVQYEGKNLLPVDVGQEFDGVVVTDSATFEEDGVHAVFESIVPGEARDIYMYGDSHPSVEDAYVEVPILTPGDYRLVNDNIGISLYVVAWRNGASVVLGYANNATTKITVQDGDKFRIFLRCNIIGDTDVKIHPMIVKEGEDTTQYEPYTGGQSSPNPDYPQEIVSAGKYDEGTQKYQYEVKLTGANLFNPAKLTGGEIVEYNGVQCYKYTDNSTNFTYVDDFAENTRYCFSVMVLSSEGNEEKNTNVFIVYTDGTRSTIKISHNQLTNEVSLANKTVAMITGGDSYSVVRYIDLTTTTLGIGTEPLPYQPYKEQTVLLQSDRPLTKWDRLEKRNGQWGWVYKSEEIESYTDESVPGEYYSTTGQLSVGAQVWYETATETFVPLSPEEQESMNALYTFRPTTVLSNDCECEMTLTYKTKKSLEVTT